MGNGLGSIFSTSKRTGSNTRPIPQGVFVFKLPTRPARDSYYYLQPMDTPTNRQRILDAFAEHLRENGQPPVSIYRFTKDLGLSEKDFFQEFPSLESVESVWWSALIDRVVQAVESGAEWGSFTARQRLLTFFFAWFEEALSVRSLIIQRFKPLGILKNDHALKGFNHSFRDFARKVIDQGVTSGEIASRGKLINLYPDALFTAFRSLIDFNLKDESPRFERTDAYIEKSVHLAFELIRTQAIDSAVDLVRFLIPEIRR